MAVTKNIKTQTTTDVKIKSISDDVSTKILTVVVLDKNGKPQSGATVSIQPSDSTSVTNSLGEVQFKLGDATKYDITATSDSSTVTVPFYLTENGATKLVVNPVYVKSLEQKMNNPLWSNTNNKILIGTGIALLIILIILVLMKKKR